MYIALVLALMGLAGSADTGSFLSVSSATEPGSLLGSATTAQDNHSASTSNSS